MIDASAIKAIAELQRQADEAKIVRIPGDDRRALIQHGAHREFVGLPPAARKHEVADLESFQQAWKEWGQSTGAVFHNAQHVALVCDESDRRDVVIWKLSPSNHWRLVCALESAHTYDQKQMIWLLRHDLAGCVDKTLITNLRQLDFSRRSDGTKTVEHGKESLGISVEASIRGRAEIPEEIQVHIPLFTNPDLEGAYTIRLTLEIDTQRAVFQLATQPGELERAMNEFQSWLGQRLREALGEAAPIFYGRMHA